MKLRCNGRCEHTAASNSSEKSHLFIYLFIYLPTYQCNGVIFQITGFSNVTLCSIVVIYWCDTSNSCLHHQGGWM